MKLPSHWLLCAMAAWLVAKEEHPRERGHDSDPESMDLKEKTQLGRLHRMQLDKWHVVQPLD